MKKMTTLTILAAALAAPVSALAADGSAYVDILSAYVYNGLVYNDEAVFQPGLDVSGPLGLGCSLWANMDLTDNPASIAPNTAGEWNEIDLGLSWAAPWEGPVGLSAGTIYYIYPQNSSTVELNEDGTVASVSKSPADGSYQVFARIEASNVPLTPAVKFCHELDNTDDWIILFTAGHGFELSDALSLDLGTVLGWAGTYYVESNYGADTGSALTHAQVDATLRYALNEKASVGLKGTFSSILDSDVRDAIDEGGVYPDTDIFFGGVTASYSF
ncbi:MAG TPA: hypothetical protein P5567_12870 [Kiritimatiellia bacterium]|nr:hypothetical protein [Kiritimatiellia bacterium]HSA18783.1 hypothetical protein [Kiritimatiellia bacterium]